MSWICYAVNSTSVQSQSNPVITPILVARATTAVDTASPYDPQTVGKILAAKRGADARAPKGEQAFIDWLNR